jgi:DNA-binding winged helix-turn-helix (wHTH) protein/TolB-like protein/tetratricopeptide (TPR) repeat protein
MPSTPPSERYAFGDFILERSQQRVLRGDSTELSLTPRLFSALLLFVERAGQLVEKDALFLALWPGLVVEENNLSQVVSGLRRALGDDTQGSRYIQTVPRRGFRFIAPVTVLPDAPPAEDIVVADPHQPPAAANSPPEDVESDPGAAADRGGGAGLLTRRSTGLIFFAAAAVGAAASAWWWLAGRASSRGSSAVRATLAVLPFKPLVAEARDELLEVGMADSLIARLSILPGLVVRSVGSVRRFAGPDQDSMRAARELDVAWIVDGSLQRRGDQLRITARLLSAPDGAAAWSGSFDQKVTGVFDMQDAISERIAGVLAPHLDPARDRRLAATATGGSRNTDAYQLYLAARQHAQGIRSAGLRKSVELYNQAIEIDPGYALAYTGLVESYRRMIFGADIAPIDAFQPAKVAVQRALELAPRLAEAHAGLGWIRYWYDFDWTGAENKFREALALNANVVEAHFGLGLLLLSLDRPDEGLSHIRWARELDPLSLILNTLEAAFLFDRGQRAEAASRLKRVFEIEPDFWVAHLTQAGWYLADGRTGEALEAVRRAEALADGSSQATALLGLMLVRMGKSDEARAVLARLVALQRTRYVPPTTVAAIQAALGDAGLALDSLELAYAVHDTRLVYMKDDRRWSTLRQQPRFVSLLRRMKLDQFGPGKSAN